MKHSREGNLKTLKSSAKKKITCIEPDVYLSSDTAKTDNITSGNLVYKKKKVWCSLSFDYLFIFTEDSDSLKCAVALRQVVRCVECDPEKCLFEVVMREGGYLLKADSFSSMTSWVLKINEARAECMSSKRYGSKDSRVEYNLIVKLSDAKDLKCEDFFCAMVVDDTEHARTNYYWNNNSPSIYNEYIFPVHLMDGELELRIYNISKKNTSLLGLVRIPFLSSMDDYYDIEPPSCPVLNLVFEWIIEGVSICITVLDTEGINLKGGIIVLKYKKKKIHETQASHNLIWKDEKCTLEIGDANEPLEFKLYNQAKEFHGDGLVDISKISFSKLESYPINLGLGKIRASLKINMSQILADEEYDELFGLLLENDMELVKMISFSVDQPKQLAKSLVNAFHRKRSSAHLIKELLKHEVQNSDSETLFRGNSVTTHAVETYMKLVGTAYLSKLLRPVITKIFKGRKPCEIDPIRLKNPKNAKKNVKNLLFYCEMIIENVFNSLDYLPSAIRDIFQKLQAVIIEKFGEVLYSGTTSFFFLRFVNICILNPTSFGLALDNPPIVISRDLTLIIKVLQNLANFTEFSEQFLYPCNHFLHENYDRMREFINELCSIPKIPPDEIPVQHKSLNFGSEMASIALLINQQKTKLSDKYGEHPLLMRAQNICSLLIEETEELFVDSEKSSPKVNRSKSVELQHQTSKHQSKKRRRRKKTLSQQIQLN